MTDRFSRVAAAALCLSACAALPAAAQVNPGRADRPISAAERATTIDSVLARFREAYVFPDVAAEMERAVRARQRRGEYGRITRAAALADSLTAHLRAVSHDRHLRVLFRAEALPIEFNERPDSAEQARAARFVAYQNGYIPRVERLPGNVGFLKIDQFGDPALATAAVRNAFAFIANTDALIIDVRENRGGDPATVALLASWLFGDRPVHLNTIIGRENGTRDEYWTRPEVPGAARYGVDKPVYVLTSARTFSGGEELAYDLQALRRATLVGETTGGAAHTVGPRRATASFIALVPYERAENPVTKTDWEGTGVRPDVSVPAAAALAAAHRMALETLLPKTDAAAARAEIRKALGALTAASAPAEASH